ncbi:MAG: hypothetical protein ACW98D_01660 [Promethearchaeota archaeon]|jgi:hypothetical protein
MNTLSMQVYQDIEWARDWEIIVKIFETIDNLKSQFNQLDVTYLRELQQNILILNLEKYAFSLQNYIIQKYSLE